MYYTALPYFRRRFDAAYRPYAFRARTAEEYACWRRDFRARLSTLLGFDKMLPCAPEPESLGTERLEGYTREKMVISTEPGVKMPFYVLRPDTAKPGERLPAVLAPHGHGSYGKAAVCGIDYGDARLRQSIDELNYDYGVQLVRAGFLVFCPDARGFGERAEPGRQSKERLLDCSCSILNAMAYPLGMNVTGMWAWDLMRLIDYALTRGDADPGRLNCAGLSGGGMQTLWLTAMDERVKNAIISGYFYGYKQSLLEMNKNCSCNYVPGLWEAADIGDVAALCAGRGVFIETGDIDPLNGADGLDNVFPQLETVRRAAGLLGNEANILHHVFHGPHMWCGERSVPWLREKNFG